MNEYKYRMVDKTTGIVHKINITDFHLYHFNTILFCIETNHGRVGGLYIRYNDNDQIDRNVTHADLFSDQFDIESEEHSWFKEATLPISFIINAVEEELKYEREIKASLAELEEGIYTLASYSYVDDNDVTK